MRVLWLGVVAACSVSSPVVLKMTVFVVVAPLVFALVVDLKRVPRPPPAQGQGKQNKEKREDDPKLHVHVVAAVLEVHGSRRRPLASRALDWGKDAAGAVPILGAQQDLAVRRAVGARGCEAGWGLGRGWYSRSCCCCGACCCHEQGSRYQCRC